MTETRETANPFQKATKTQSRLRLALEGPPGSGKTYTALAVASALGERVPRRQIAVALQYLVCFEDFVVI